jgi:UDP-glucose 4-epimerase
MRKILVTGGAGFIASCLAERLIQNSDNYVVILDNLLTGHKDNLPSVKKKNWTFIKSDVNILPDISQVMVSYKFDYVFHYAAVVGVKRTLNNPVKVLEDIEGIRNILNLSKNTGVKRIYYSSSSEVYGEPVEYPQNEDTTPLNSRLPYAVVKNIGESFIKSYHKEYGLEYTIFRFFNTYGPRQSVDFVVSKFLHAALKNQEITIYGDGQQTRTFCYIDDNISATVNAFEDDKYVNDVVNIGSEKEVPIIDLAKEIIKVCKSKSKIVHLPALKEGDMTRRQPDTSKMKVLLKRKLTPLSEGLMATKVSGRF